MKSPRFLAALAMAAVLTTGVTAHALTTTAPTTSDFKIDTGNAGSGQQATQTAIKHHDTNPTQVAPATGEINVNGTFNKVITNLPTPDKEGHYLRITMPISMDYVYNLDTHHMQTATALIQNQSVKVTGQVGQGQKVDPQPVEMSFVRLSKKNNTSQNSKDFKFVKSVNPAEKDVIQLPFTLQVSGASTPVANYDLADIETAALSLQPLTIQGGSNINLTLDLVGGQKVGNPELVNQAKTLTTHGLELKFEYKGQ